MAGLWLLHLSRGSGYNRSPTCSSSLLHDRPLWLTYKLNVAVKTTGLFYISHTFPRPYETDILSYTHFVLLYETLQAYVFFVCL